MKRATVLIIGGIGIIGAGAFAWWTLSPLLIDRQVHDDLPPQLQTKGAREDESGTQPADTTATNTATEGPFPIVDTAGHPASGNVRLIRTPEETIVRYEDYDGTNGPDLFVYLAKDLDAEAFVNLGRAKGNKGNINYTIPAEIDVSEYRYVVTWCRAFGVLFDYAELN